MHPAKKLCYLPTPLWYARIPSGSHLTEMLALICSAFPREEAPKTNSANRKCFSAGPTLCNLTGHVSILSKHKALTGFSA